MTATRTSSELAGAWRLASCEAGRIACVLIVETFVFIPYVVSTMADDGAGAQTVLAVCCTASGLFAAVTTPLLYALLRAAGSGKWVLGVVTVLLSLLLLALWWVDPDGGLDSTAAFVAIGLVNMVCAYRMVAEATIGSELLAQGEQSRASANGAAIANVASAALLVALLWGFVWPGTVTWWFVPAQPLLGLDALSYEPERASGPLMAIVAMLSALPLLLMRRGGARSNRARDTPIAFSKTLATLKQAVTASPSLVYYYLGRITLANGLLTLVLFGGIFVSSDFRLSTTVRLLTGAVILFGAGLGVVADHALNRRLGPRATLQIEMACITGWIVVQLGQSFLRIVLPKAIVVDLLVLSAFLGSAALLGASASWPRGAVGQTLPEDPLPPSALALLASVTTWVGPLLVAIFTTVSRSVAAGLVPIVVMIALGFIALRRSNTLNGRALTTA